jgi:hypothetical protein
MPNFIGVSGLAGSGKDLFCSQVKSFYSKNKKLNRKVHIFALASSLKEDVKKSCLDIYGIDSVKANREEKNKIREMLVFYGDVMRQKSKGSHWVLKMEEKVSSLTASGKIKDNDIVMISDIRYAEFKEDEVQWVKNKGTLVHISKHVELDYATNKSYPFAKKFYESPPNEKERVNDPKVKKSADYLIDWPHLGCLSGSALTNYIKNFCDWYETKLQ